MKVTYVAGPYRAEHAWQIDLNIDKAKLFAMSIWSAGHVALCPHLNSPHFDGLASAEAFIEGTLELMRRCDAVFVLPSSEDSEGTQGEIQEAKRLGIPLFFDMPSLLDWLDS